MPWGIYLKKIWGYTLGIMSETTINYPAVWVEAIKQLRGEISDTEYMMWLNNLSYENSKENSIVARVPSKLILDQVKTRYGQILEDKLEELSDGKKVALEFIVKKNAPADTKEDKKEPMAATFVDKTQRRQPHFQLNEKYSFENFVIGENNKYAANAAIAIADTPGTAFNPCLIYGGVGLGKTHLIQAIGNTIHKKFEDKKIVYVTAESFMNEFISQVVINRTPQKFKNKYRNTDVLLIDDIHFLQKKEDTLEELFHTFNALHDNNKQIVFTCDRPIAELKDMADRIKSRFSQGLTVSLDAPSYETRYAILKKEIERLSIIIPDEVVNLICNNVTTNVRELKAALTRLVGYAQFINKNITLEVAKVQLRDFFTGPQQNNVTIDIIKRAVADYYGISINDLSARKRTKALSDPRQVAMYITREITEYAITEIGEKFGKDHSTVSHACERVKRKMKADPTLEPTIQKLIKQIKENSIKE
jgi:chromosomal replication initiator protein